MTEAATATPPHPTPPPHDRYCDLVMKGGITSGVVYPRAISRLAAQYRFRSIGGSSAGAIAAAVTAAAEYQRRHGGTLAGFTRLSRLPDELCAASGDGARRKLLSLFQPQAGTARLFTVLVSALNRGSAASRLLGVLRGLVQAYARVLLPALLAGALAWVLSSPLAGVLLALLLGGAALAAAVVHDIARPLVGNGYGLCNGMPGDDSPCEALTPWLHGLIQQAAGRRADDAPLTFGDLWAAPDGPPPAPGDLQRQATPAPAARSIDLQMFATNLTHGRPYVFPLDERQALGLQAAAAATGERLYFSPQELRPYLPDAVHDWLVRHGRAHEVPPGREALEPGEAEAMRLGLLQLPAPEHLPVLLATRMSLSFPLLFSAVPLWAIDSSGRQPVFRRCWFSDGGICSNFPMHLFDGLVPRWPTFGISLEPSGADDDSAVYLPGDYHAGYGERWDGFDARPGGLGRFGGFLAAVATTMQEWNDNVLTRMPGVRDRVARVRLQPHEGGLNLDMAEGTIREIAARGTQAAGALLERFAPPGEGPAAQAATAPAGPGWDEHRLVRLNVLLKMIEARAAGVVSALGADGAHATSIDVLIERARSTTAPGYAAPLDEAQAAALHQAVAALRQHMQAMAQVAASDAANPFVALPKPELRVRPPL
jgi:predicted acylesterase/phospholipase RssA